ncbi:MAG: heavy-metal-associated domain-containing protein [Bacteroidales bacterium]|nr:heavy-metal-associated domain-containing protein [Bacteroidales bacterium]
MKILLITFILQMGFIANSQEEKDDKFKEIEIKTSAQCEMCKERIEKNMAFEKGVKDVVLDLETKVLTIKYRSDKTDPGKLKKAVSKIGYDADDVAADPKAYEKLPDCCKKGGHDHEH